MMECFLSSLNSFIATWLGSSLAPWVTDTIFAVLCGVGLFLLLLPFLESKPSSPPHRKHRKIKKCPVEPKRRSKKNNRTLKACRNCLQELEEAQGLVSLLRSHFARLSNKGGFRQRSHDLSGDVCKEKPAEAHQPCGEPVEDVAPVIFSLASPAPLTEHPPPLSSTLSPSPMTSSVSAHSCSSTSASQPPEPFLPMDILLPQPPALSTSTSCFLDSENHPQDCTTDTLQGCHSVFLDADISTSHVSLFSSMSVSSGDMSAPKVLHEFTSGGERSQQESLRLKDLSKSQSKMFGSSYEKEDSRRLNPGMLKEGLAEMKNSQAGGINLDKKSKEPLRRKSFHLMQKEQPPPESFLKNRIKYFLQWMFPRKDKKLKDDPQKGQPVSATDQSSEPVKSGPIMGSRADEDDILATAVGQILEKKMALCNGLCTSEVNWRKEELQAPEGPHLCYQRALSYKEQRRRMENMANDYQFTPNGHNYPNKSRWTRDRDSKWFFPPMELGSPERSYQHELRMTRPSDQIHYCPVPCPLRKYVSLGQPECASHAFLGRNFLQEKMYTVQKETLFYHVSTPPVC